MWLMRPALFQATWRVLQPPEESGGFGTTDTSEETVSASQQNQQHCQPGALHGPGDAGAGLQSHPGMAYATGWTDCSTCANRKVENRKCMINNCIVLFWCFFPSQVIENLDTLSSLQSLFLGTNKITRLQNLDGLHNLSVLSIQVVSQQSLSTLKGGQACRWKHPSLSNSHFSTE